MNPSPLLALSLALAAPSAIAQAPAQDTIRLGTLQAGAARRDPRARELDLLIAQVRLRQRNLDMERRPSLTVESQAQYQSEVARIPIALPGGAAPPIPPHDTYDAKIVAQQRLYDPTLAPRRAVEDAQSSEAISRLRATLYGVRQTVNDLYFASLRAQSQIAELETSIIDVEAQLRVADARMREGQALPSEAMAIRAELLRRHQSVAEFAASRRSTLDVLADLTGRPLDTLAVLALPDGGTEVASAREALAGVRARPEYEQFARSRDVLYRQGDARV